ncbi:MAG: DUF2961 domain-containing protein [Spartobacteria bacterium]|nr:DUF2961 domain-containing protein [Spartobacteria bacterium]
MRLISHYALVCILFITALLNGCGKNNSCPLKDVNLGILLERMTNLNTFAEAPLGPSFLESSYDRSGGNQDWVVYTQAEPTGRITVFEADGPGYISRIWIASYYAKRWLFFFDGEKTPRLDLTQDELFGGAFPFSPPLAGKSSGGHYSLLPIPFSKRLRIEIVPENLDPGSRNYYHINYTRLDLSSRAVQSFPKELSTAQSNLVVAVNAFQSSESERQSLQIDDCMKDATQATLAPGQSFDFWNDSGEGLLRLFCIRIDSPDKSDVMSYELLRGLRLQMFWNGATKPSVDVPLGDFFCNPFYLRTFSSMPLGQQDAAFISQFPMPYQNGARCRLINGSTVPVSLSFGAKGDKESSQGLSRLFHAKWNADTGKGLPFNMLSVNGPGHYVGCFLSAIGQDGSWNILEGDDILAPDRNKRMPQYGTGLEDYFSGAYYYTTLMDLPLHGLIEKGAMRTDQYRFHLLDAVSFDESFDASIEFGHANAAQGVMNSVAYWYSDAPGDQTLPQNKRNLLQRPADRFELHGLMTQLFMLEREGLYADAADRMEFFAKRYAGQPWVELLNVRALGYREKVEGFEAVRADYEALTQSANPSVAQTAKDRLWLAENPSHALLGIHALCKYKLMLDGQDMAEGTGQNELRVLRITLPEGEHVWDVDLAPTHQGSFFSLCVQTRQGTMSMPGDWDTLNMQVIPGTEAPDKFSAESVLPNMTIWAFNPNGYVGMQSPANGIDLWYFWAGHPRIAHVRLRKNWVFGDYDDGALGSLKERTREELRAHAID